MLCRPAHFRFAPCVDGSELARVFFTSQGWSLQPCVRPLDAVHMTAGHNALRGSGPDRKPAFENASGRVGCPDRRIDRLCITCVDGSELARVFFTSQGWSLQPCVRPLDAVHMTAGHNALRGSGPDRKPAFENASGRVGCPDRRIDRLCITCCSPSQPSHHVGCPTRSVTPQARRVPCNARP